MAIVKATRRGNSIYICIPPIVSKRGNIKKGDVFSIVRDNLLPDVYILKKMNDANEI